MPSGRDEEQEDDGSDIRQDIDTHGHWLDYKIEHVFSNAAPPPRLVRSQMLRMILVGVVVATLPQVGGCNGMSATVEVKAAFADPLSASLAEAVVQGNLPGIDAAVQQGASVNAMDREGLNMLGWALNRGQEASLQKLLTLGANPNQLRPRYGTTTLHSAALNANSKWLQMLLKAGADPNIADSAGETPLFRAISSDETARNVDLLLDAGADVNHQDDFGDTVAMLAATIFDYPNVLRFLQRGACISPKNHNGKDLLALTSERVPAAREREAARQEVLQYLRQHHDLAC